jgi:hypothetical protein
MSEAQNPGERLRELAKSLNLSFDEIVGDLLSPSAPPASADAPAALGPFRVSEAAIRAAISDSYSASEIQAADGEREILEQSEVIMIGGRRRLRLSDSARAVILREAAGNERFGALLNQAIASDKQNPSAIGDEVESRSVCLRRSRQPRPPSCVRPSRRSSGSVT